jgi:hypothetical protein
MRLDPPSDRSSRRASPTDRPDEHAPGNVAPERRASELTAERHAEIRRRVLNGAYNGSGVIDEVARRLLASGDLSR